MLESGDDAGKDGLLKYLEGVSDKVVFGAVNLGKVYGFVVAGENVNGMKKGKAMMHKNACMNLIEGK